MAASHALFLAGEDDASMPTTELTADQVKDGAVNVLDLLMLCGIAASKSEGRRVITQGGLSINDQPVKSPDLTLTEGDLRSGVKIRKGKKTYHKVVLV